MSEYVPSAEEALYEIRTNATSFNSAMTGDGFAAALTRWLTHHDAEVAAFAWQEGRFAGHLQENPYRIEEEPPRAPYEDDFGDASIGRAMAAARERGDMPAENVSRLKPKEEA